MFYSFWLRVEASLGVNPMLPGTLLLGAYGV